MVLNDNIQFLLTIMSYYQKSNGLAEIAGIIHEDIQGGQAVVLSDWSKLRLAYNNKIGWHILCHIPIINRDIEKITWITIK